MQKFSIKAPMTGILIPIEKVEDDVFSEKMLGDGVAIIPKNGDVYAPADGTVETIADTLHAVGIKTDGGAEILIHCGVDTINLRGRGFTSFVKVGDKVKTGDLILKADLSIIHSSGLQVHTPIIITNMDELSDISFAESEEVFACESDVIFYNRKQTIVNLGKQTSES